MTTPAAAPRGTWRGRPGVAGWLLVVCVFMTLIGPVISAALLLHRQAAVSPLVVDSAILDMLLRITLWATVAVTVYGAVAGLRLWRLRPGAVGTARRALLAGLAVDIACTAFDIATHPGSSFEANLVRQLLWQSAPDLVLFTACLGYLQHSRRVQATYPGEA